MKCNTKAKNPAPNWAFKRTPTWISTTATLSDNSTIALFNLIGPDE